MDYEIESGKVFGPTSCRHVRILVIESIANSSDW